MLQEQFSCWGSQVLRKQKHAAMSILIFNIVPLGITICSADLLLIIPGVSDMFQPAAHKITTLLPFMQITHQIQVVA